MEDVFKGVEYLLGRGYSFKKFQEEQINPGKSVFSEASLKPTFSIESAVKESINVTSSNLDKPEDETDYDGFDFDTYENEALEEDEPEEPQDLDFSEDVQTFELPVQELESLANIDYNETITQEVIPEERIDIPEKLESKPEFNFGKPKQTKVFQEKQQSAQQDSQHTKISLETSTKQEVLKDLPDKIEEYLERIGKPVLINEILHLYGKDKLNRALLEREVFKFNDIKQNKVFIML